MMNEVLMSQFIDNELDLQEKVEFVEAVKANPPFAEEMLELLDQERLLQDITPLSQPVPVKKKFFSIPVVWWRQPIAAFAAVLLICAVMVSYTLQQGPTGSQEQEYRFVLYRPSALQVSVIGTFTGWSPVPMREIGSTGYWTLNLRIPSGEHRYSFLLDRDRQLADPTVTAREPDDFGGENSILILGDVHEPIS